MLKKIILALLAIFVVIQFIKPAKNQSNDETMGISKKYPVPDDVNQLLKSACYDCHSNYTNYPWYANLQPVAWWLNHHVEEGKGELNFSTFLSRKVAVQNHKFEEIIDEVKEKKMPLPSYTMFGLHKDANLSDAQREIIIKWAQTQMDSLKAQYPADSLVLKRKPQAPPSK